MITEFKSGHWYRWTGPRERQDGWNDAGSMDFILDGKPHQCKEGRRRLASFFNSPESNHIWDWVGYEACFEEPPYKYKPFRNPFPDWWDGIPILCKVRDVKTDPEPKQDFIVAVVPDDNYPYKTMGDSWIHAEPVIKTEPTEEYYLTKKVSGEVKGETRLTPEQIRELGVSDE